MSKRQKLSSNKIIDETSIPPKPEFIEKIVDDRKFVFRLTFTNGAIFNKFLLPISNAVHEMMFTITKTDDFVGLKLSAHDTYMTLANKSRFECDVEVDQKANDELLEFSVNAPQFMQTLSCSTLKDTVLTITKYENDNQITFESCTNENDVHATYSCDVLADCRLHQQNLDAMQFDFGFHITLCLKTLKEITSNAKRCGASHVYFELFQIEMNDVVHSKLKIGFKGQSTSGSHDFYTSAKKITEGETLAYEPIPISNAQKQLKYTKKSYNEYDNSKLRLFLNHMDIEWIMLHLCNDMTNQPLVMDCIIGGQNTKHIIIVAPKLNED